MLYHAELLTGGSGWFSRAYLFVDFFFLLSGFVLTLSAEARMSEPGGASRFLRARVMRLWPMTALGVVAGAIAALALGAPQDVLLFAALGLLMIPALFHQGQLFPLNGPQWSLFLELLANALHALLLRRLGDRALLGFVVVSGAMLAATVLRTGANDLGPFAFNWWWGLPRVLFSYALGAWFGRQWLAGRQRPLVSWEMALVLPPVFVVALSGLPIANPVGDILIVLLIFPACFWLAAGAAVPEAAKAWLGRLGDISFPLYALHLPLLTICVRMDHATTGMALALSIALIGKRLFAPRLSPAPQAT